MLKELVLKNRSYRKFQSDKSVSLQTLESLIDLARNTPSSKNFQPLIYILVDSKQDCDHVFESLGWAKHLSNWDGPEISERPPAYVIMLLDKNLNQEANIDAGISAQTILLGATELGLGGCIIRTVDREKLTAYFNLPKHLEIILVIAIGEPNQKVKLIEVSDDEQSTYFEKDGIHFVPKRTLKQVTFKPQVWCSLSIPKA